MNLNIKARLLAAIAQFKAEHDIRYYLNGVYVEPDPEGGVFVVATNGHMMGVWRDPEGVAERAAILRVGKPLQTACSGSGDRRVVIRDQRLAVIGEKSGLEYYIQNKDGVNKTDSWEVEGKFPHWQKVVPSQCPIGIASPLHPKYVATVADALKIGVHNGKHFEIAFSQPAKHLGTLVTSAAAEEFFAVIMPVHAEKIEPKWLNRIRVKPADPEQAVPPASQPVDEDPLYLKAVEIVFQHQRASISLVQRHLSIGYNHATRLLAEMARKGILRDTGSGYEIIWVGPLPPPAPLPLPGQQPSDAAPL